MMMHGSDWIGCRVAKLDWTATRRVALRRRRFLLGLLPLLLVTSAAAAADFHFVDRAAELGITHTPSCGSPRGRTLIESSGSGVALFDFDLDRDLDLLLLDGSTLERIGRGEADPDRLLRNDGARFTDVTDSAGLNSHGWSQGVQVGDIDTDGDPDLYITRFGPDRLYRNEGNGTFTDRTAAAGLGADGWSTAAAFGDIDADGDLDLYVVRYLALDPVTPPRPGVDGDCLWRGILAPCGPADLPPLTDRLYLNDGSGVFADVTETSGIGAAGAAPGTDVRIADLDGDGDLDIAVTNDGAANLLFRNDGAGRMTEVGFTAGIARDELGAPGSNGALELVDWSGDGRLDLYAAGDGGEPDLVYEHHQALGFRLGQSGARLAYATRGARTVATSSADFDNDGDLDLLAIRGERLPLANAHGTSTRFAQVDRLFENRDGELRIVPKTGSALDQPAVSRGVAVGDLDDDGDLDLIITRLREQPLILINTLDEGREVQASLTIRLEGPAAHGALVDAHTNGHRLVVAAANTGGRSCSDPRLHIGMGWEDRADSVRVLWPGGWIDTLGTLSGGAEYTVRRGVGIVDRRWLTGGMR